MNKEDALHNFIEVSDIEQISQQDYRQDPAYNQSYLKQAYYAPHKVLEEQEENEGQAFGGLVDAMLFGTFNSDYVVMPPELDNISDNVRKVIEYAYSMYGDMSQTAIEESAAQIGYGQKWKSETLVKKIHEGGGEDAGIQYFDILKEQHENNKKLVTTEDYTRALETEQIVGETYKNIIESTEHQVGLKAMINDTRSHIKFQLKGLLDMINRDDKIIYDLKVLSKDLRSFGPAYYLKFGYYIQAITYYLITEMKYTFKFCLVNPNYPHLSYIRTVTPQQMQKAYNGFEYNNYYYPGLLWMLQNAQQQEQWGFEAPTHVMRAPNRTVVLPYEHF